MRVKDQWFAIIFILCISMAGIYALFINNEQEISQLEKRKLSNIKDFTVNNWVNKDFQNSVENTVADHYIARNQWIKQYNRMEIYLNIVSNDIISEVFHKFADKQILIQQVSKKLNLVTLNGQRYLVRPSHVYDENIENGIINNINKINFASNKYNNIDFFVYLPTSPEDTTLFDKDSAGDRYLNQFNKLEIRHAKLEIRNIQDYQRMFFKTDHHWNHIGAYQGYADITNLLFDKKVKPYSPIDVKTFDSVDFYGSNSAKIAHAVQLEPDKLSKYIFQLPQYKLYINGKIVEEYGNYSKYLSGKIDKTFGFDHYNSLYQSRRGEIIFDTGRENDYDNILVISDSMSNPIRDVIASHFNKSVFINLDRYNAEIGEFNLGQYIKKYKIKKILFMVILENYFPEGELKHLDYNDI